MKHVPTVTMVTATYITGVFVMLVMLVIVQNFFYLTVVCSKVDAIERFALIIIDLL